MSRGDGTSCPNCRLPTRLCVCEKAPRLSILTPLLLLVHVQDFGRTSNTVRLLSLAIPEAIVLCHGVFPSPADPASRLPTESLPLVLFPGHGAKPLTPDRLASLPSPPALIVPDGSWRQASRMVKRLPMLASAEKVSLPERAFAGPALRRNSSTHRMSTYEAVTQALAVIEGESVAASLLDFYRRATDRMLYVRGKLAPSDVYGGV